LSLAKIPTVQHLSLPSLLFSFSPLLLFLLLLYPLLSSPLSLSPFLLFRLFSPPLSSLAFSPLLSLLASPLLSLLLPLSLLFSPLVGQWVMKRQTDDVVVVWLWVAVAGFVVRVV